MGLCELQASLRSLQDRRQQLRGRVGRQRIRGAGSDGLGSRVNYKRELTVGKRKISYIPFQQFDRGIARKMWGSLMESVRRTRQHDGLRVQIKSVVGRNKTFQQPAAKESCSPGDKKSSPAQFFPQCRIVF